MLKPADDLGELSREARVLPAPNPRRRQDVVSESRRRLEAERERICESSSVPLAGETGQLSRSAAGDDPSVAASDRVDCLLADGGRCDHHDQGEKAGGQRRADYEGADGSPGKKACR